MARLDPFRRNLLGSLAIIFVGGAFLRFIGIGYGLPAVFNGDEPHIVNIAVSFGAGTLHPHFLKYPTFWMYILFAVYGLYFAAWSGFGLLHSVREFGELFAWDPTVFYLLGRGLAAFLSVAALERVFRSGKLLWGNRAGVWAAALLAVSPTLVVSAHAAKPESLMLFLAAWSWWFAARYLDQAKPRDLILSGFAAGLACASQYIAVPLAVMVVAAGTVRKAGLKRIGLSLGAVLLGLAIGSPYVFLDWPSFLQMLQERNFIEQANLEKWGAWLVRRSVLWNLITFSGPWFPGGVLLGAGLVEIWRERRPFFWVFVAPTAVMVIILWMAGEGGWQRYQIPIYPGLALVAAYGVEVCLARLGVQRADRQPSRRHSFVWAVGLAILLLPGGWRSWAYDREVLLPDTRTLAGRWIEQNVRPGTKILLDQEHESPRVPLSMEAIDALIRQTALAGHPKRRFYEFMKSGHPGGGFFIYRIRRDPWELGTGPGHTQFSQQAHLTIDVKAGLQPARAQGVELVAWVVRGGGFSRLPGLERFHEEVAREGALLADFVPEAGFREGPQIAIYRISSK